MKKRIIPIGISVVVILALALAGLHYARAGNGPGGMGIPIKPDYSLVPIYTMQGSQAYMNAQATPLLFIDRTDNSGKFAQAVQGALQELHPARPLVIVSTDFSSPDLKSAEAVTAAFGKQYNLMLPVVLQAGDAHAYAPQAPMMIYYTIENGKPVQHVLTKVPTQDELVVAVGRATPILIQPTKPQK